MNPHQTCQTCLFNVAAECTNEASRYKGAQLKSWNTCSAHQAPMPDKAELIARLDTCAAGLDHLAAKAAEEYRGYFGDRAQQCRSWAADLKEGHRSDLEYIAGGLAEFEAMAL